MSVAPISAVVTSSVTPTAYLPSVSPTAASAAGATDGAFASTLSSSVDSLQAMQANTDQLAVKAVTGNLSDVHDYTIAATESSVAMELTATVRNRAVEAFNEIMRMQA
jgi:flagellar hook-basal body complex protein FliE